MRPPTSMSMSNGRSWTQGGRKRRPTGTYVMSFVHFNFSNRSKSVPCERPRRQGLDPGPHAYCAGQVVQTFQTRPQRRAEARA